MLQNLKMNPCLIILLMFSLAALTSCDSTSDDGTQTNLTLQFQTSNSSTSNKVSNAESGQLNDTLRVDGSNGTLVIDDIRFIVEDFELERAEGECDNLEGAEEEGCEEFEADPFFVDLPLEGELLNLDTSPIEAGLYEELEFEVEDIDFDEEEDSNDEESKQELRNQVRSEFPDWPESVSMVITGIFTDNQGNESPFKTFAEAEVEIEMEFNPPLEVGEDTINRLLRINIDPALWFTKSDGSVIDLSQHDFESTGSILELEVEIENGFLSIEVDDENDDDDD